MRASLTGLSLYVAASLATSAPAYAIPVDEASGAFALAREVIANQADLEGKLAASQGVWSGKLPAEIAVANTAIEWGGVRWTMVIWQPPADVRELAQLLTHECYHRIQPALK